MMGDSGYTHRPCGGQVWAEEWVTSILARCEGCGKVWHILDPMNDVFDKEGKPRCWLFGPNWCRKAKDGV